MAEQTNALHDALASAIEPIKQQLAQTDLEIEELEASLNQKRKDRTAARNVLRVLDPESVPAKQQSTLRPKALNVSDDKLDALVAFLRNRENGDAFSPRVLLEENVPMSRATVTNALHILRDRGLIRLDHMGQGGANFYRATKALSE